MRVCEGVCVEVKVCGGEGVCVLCGCGYKLLDKSDIPRQFVQWLLVAPHMNIHSFCLVGDTTSKLF